MMTREHIPIKRRSQVFRDETETILIPTPRWIGFMGIFMVGYIA
jgi:hypothetical protein